MLERVGPIAGFREPKLPKPDPLITGAIALPGGIAVMDYGINLIQATGFPLADVWGKYWSTVFRAPYVTPILGIIDYVKMFESAPLGTAIATGGLTISLWGVSQLVKSFKNSNH